MNEATRHRLMCGWLRLFLGYVQVSLAAMAVGALLTVGFHPVTWAFAIAATTATIIGRLIYHGRSGPDLKRHKTQKVTGSYS